MRIRIDGNSGRESHVATLAKPLRGRQYLTRLIRGFRAR
jgi:hypothetical protein